MSGVATTAGKAAVPLLLRAPLLAVAGTSALVVVVLGLVYSGDSSAGGWDLRVMAAVETLWPDPGAGALVIDGTSEPIGAATLVALLVTCCLALGRRRLALLAVAGPAFTVITTTALKPLVDRTIHGEHLAYPSGHTATATALALVVGLLVVDLLRTSRVPGAVVLVLTGGTAGTVMAVDQIALTAHYPTDTVGGFFTATTVLPVVALLIDQIADRRAGGPTTVLTATGTAAGEVTPCSPQPTPHRSGRCRVPSPPGLRPSTPEGATMRLRSNDISTRTIGSETIVLALPSSQYFTITGVGTRLFELLVEDVSIDDLVGTIVEEYEVDAATARSDIEAFIGRLRDAQLLH